MSSASYYSLEQQNQIVDRPSSSDFVRSSVEPRNDEGAFFASAVEERRSTGERSVASVAVDSIVVLCGDAGSRAAMRRCLEVENVGVVEAASSETLSGLALGDAAGFLIDSATLDASPETLCRQLVDKYPDAPIIFMDEPTGDAERRKRLSKFVHSYIVKPCERQALLQATRQVLKLSRMREKIVPCAKRLERRRFPRRWRASRRRFKRSANKSKRSDGSTRRF
ncbi:MAG: response regulator [Thermoguttaceae bacterium]|nr:response regulator [Thermoguttaceae bacterium]